MHTCCKLYSYSCIILSLSCDYYVFLLDDITPVALLYVDNRSIVALLMWEMHVSFILCLDRNVYCDQNWVFWNRVHSLHSGHTMCALKYMVSLVIRGMCSELGAIHF